jgi:HSP20 family molecular chaperone IbpA
MFLLLLTVLSTCLAQFQNSPTLTPPPAFDRQKRRLELREEMHRRMRDKLLHGVGPDQDMFKDMEKMMDEAMTEANSGFDVMAPADHYATEWVRSNSGQTLVITPKNPKQQLDIDVKANMITIKGNFENKSGGSTYISNFSNSFGIPEECDGNQVKINQKDGKILVELPYRVVKKVTVPKKEERKPLPPSSGEVTI